MTYKQPLATSSEPGQIKIAGDISGTASSITVIKLQNVNVVSTTPTNGQVLAYNLSNTRWEPTTVSSTPSGSAGGDLGSTYPNPTVVSLTGSGGTLNVASTAAIINFATATSAPTLKQADNTTNSATGQALTVQAQNATGTTATGGNLVLKSGTGTSAGGIITFNVGSSLKGYFDANGVLRVGSSASGGVTVFTSVNLPGSSDIAFGYNTNSDTSARYASDIATAQTSLEVYNVATGAANTIGLRALAAGTAISVADWQGNSVIEQIGSSTSCLVFAKILGSGSSRATIGRLFQSGAFALGNATNNDTSSEAQAGLTGAIINMSAATGTITSASDQSTLYNLAGVGSLQGHSGVNLVVNTSTVLTTTSTGITSSGAVNGTSIGVGSGTPPTITSGTGIPGTTPQNGSVYMRTDGNSTNGVYVYQQGVWAAVSALDVSNAGGVTCTAGTSVGNVDTLVYTIPASPTGNGRFILSAVILRLETALVGANNVTLTVGTTSGGNDLLTASVINSSTTVGTIYGLTLSTLGTAFVANDGYSATLAAGATIYVRLATDGALTTGPVFKAHVYGAHL